MTSANVQENERFLGWTDYVSYSRNTVVMIITHLIIETRVKTNAVSVLVCVRPFFKPAGCSSIIMIALIIVIITEYRARSSSSD